MPDTSPFCASCGWDFVAKNITPDQFCDSCGADLFNSIAADGGPQNPPSVPNGTDATGGVASFSFVPSIPISYDTYTFEFSVNGVVTEVRSGVTTTPQTYTAEVGDTVCARLAGIKDGIGSGYGASECVTLA